MKRAGIYLFFDKHGIADDYIIRMIEDLKRDTEFMLVVCNGYVQTESLFKLKNAADEVICRANAGFDLGAYRDGILWLGYKELEQYDEIIFVNYTNFGPVGSFSAMFEEMEKKDVDFWGITKHHHMDSDPFNAIEYGFLPEHIQSHFLAVRRKLFMSYEYRDFVMNRRNPESYIEAICSYEAIFTKYFSDLGYRWAIWSDSAEYDQISAYPLMYRPVDMLVKKNCTILKRRAFFHNYDDFLYYTGGEPTALIYDRIRQDNVYDTDLIWDNLLRLENMSALQMNMHLDYMCDPDHAEDAGENGRFLCVLGPSEKDLVFYEKSLQETAGGFRGSCCFGEDQGLSFCEFLKAAADAVRDEDLVLVLDLSKKEEERTTDLLLNSFVLSHLAQGKGIPASVSEHFGKNERMGMLVSPLPVGGRLLEKYSRRWIGRFAELKKRAAVLEPSLNFEEKYNPLLPAGGSFWIRGSLLKKCAGHLDRDDDRDLITLLLPLLVQHYGFYTGRAFNTKEAPKYLEEQLNIMRYTNKVLFKLYGSDIHMSLRGKIIRDGQ